jgi:hypothetical protein
MSIGCLEPPSAGEVAVDASDETPPYAADDFERNVEGGWGDADVGGAWSLAGGSEFSVAGGAGRMALGAAVELHALLPNATSTSTDMSARFSIDKPVSGNGVYVHIVARQIGDEDYRLTLIVRPNASIDAVLEAAQGATAVALAGPIQVPDLEHQPEQVLAVRLLAVGVNPSDVRARVWRAGEAEPDAWLLSSIDATASLQGPGHIATTAYLSASADDAPVEFAVHEVSARPGE